MHMVIPDLLRLRPERTGQMLTGKRRYIVDSSVAVADGASMTVYNLERRTQNSETTVLPSETSLIILLPGWLTTSPLLPH